MKSEDAHRAGGDQVPQGRERPIILVTNDDGIRANGLAELARAMVGLGKVLVVAPDRERSATGHAITVHKPLRADPVPLAEGVEAYAVNGTPSDCVKLGTVGLGRDRPDLVISGINRGANLGTDVLYSGTVSAAVEGALLHIPSIAVSLAAYENPDYRPAAAFSRRLAEAVLENGLPPDTLLNVNVPGVSESELAGVRVTRLGLRRRYRDGFERRLDPRGREYYWLIGDAVDQDVDLDVDAVAVRNNQISVTPIQLDLTNQPFMAELEGWTLFRVRKE